MPLKTHISKTKDYKNHFSKNNEAANSKVDLRKSYKNFFTETLHERIVLDNKQVFWEFFEWLVKMHHPWSNYLKKTKIAEIDPQKQKNYNPWLLDMHGT